MLVGSRMPVPAPAGATATVGAPWRPGDTVGVSGSVAVARLIAERTGLPVEDGDDVRVEIDPDADIPNEGYTLDIRAGGVRIAASGDAGAFYAGQTLVQLLDDREGRWSAEPASISDAPRFAYRGVMLDVARHFFPVETVRGWVDRAAGLKLNHLHLHLTDDQGWRLALESRPALAERASATAIGGDPGGVWSLDEWRGLVAYAASQCVTIVPEIDTPGHTHAISLAYPEIVEEPVITPEVRAAAEEFGGGLPVHGSPYTGFAVGFSSLRIGDRATAAFLADVFGELAKETPGPYLHVGGDEAHGTPPEQYAAFIAQVTGLVTSFGKTPIAWHEAGASSFPGTVGQYWGYAADVIPPEARGFSGLILSPSDVAYLDMKRSDDDPLGLAWADGPTSVEAAYDWDPDDVAPGSVVVGVEAPLWTETLRTADELDEMAFPRLAAIAEIAWSLRSARSWESFRERVADLGPLWARRGIRVHRSPEIPWRG